MPWLQQTDASAAELPAAAVHPAPATGSAWLLGGSHQPRVTFASPLPQKHELALSFLVLDTLPIVLHAASGNLITGEIFHPRERCHWDGNNSELEH